MHLQIAPAITITPLAKHQMEGVPRWMLDGRRVLIAPYHSADEHDKHVSQTVGSMEWLWSDTDELRFDTTTLILQSVMLNVPDVTLSEGGALSLWQMAPQQEELPQLAAPKNFQIEPSLFRWMDAEGKALTCLLPYALEDAQQRLRLCIAQDLDLLFANERYCGWSLHHPARYLVEEWEEPSLEDTNTSLVTLLYEYLILVTDPSIEQMEDRDPELLNQLLGLYKRTQSLDGQEQRLRILRAAIADKVDRFYDQRIDGSIA